MTAITLQLLMDCLYRLTAQQKNIELGLFSTDIVENIGISKTFNAKNYADFGGANINIDSKNFRGQPYLNLSLSLGGNSNTIGKDLFIYKMAPDFGFYNATCPRKCNVYTSN